MVADRSREVAREEAYQASDAELAVLIDHLVSIARDLLEALHQIGRIEACTSQSKVLARTAVQVGYAVSVYPQLLFAVTPAVHLREQLLQLLPVALVQLLELERGHGWRLPRNHCATPSTRRVTSGPDRPRSPETGAARAASSSSRSAVNREARAARAMTAA